MRKKVILGTMLLASTAAAWAASQTAPYGAQYERVVETSSARFTLIQVSKTATYAPQNARDDANYGLHSPGIRVLALVEPLDEGETGSRSIGNGRIEAGFEATQDRDRFVPGGIVTQLSAKYMTALGNVEPINREVHPNSFVYDCHLFGLTTTTKTADIYVTAGFGQSEEVVFRSVSMP